MASKSLGAEYNGNLQPLAIRRLNKERANFERDNLHDQGIYHNFDSCVHKATALILGPEDTPYSCGFYLFEFTFPNNYPLSPPHVSFRTGDDRVRFNPNLYVNGKVCLSILGTWQGPSWTSSCTFRTTLLSIQSLLCNRPLQNEPGHENNNGRDCELYSAMIRYENVAVAVALQLSRPLPEPLAPLRRIMARLFVRHFPKYLRVLDEYDSREGTSVKCPLYSFMTKYSASTVRSKLEEVKQALLKEPDLSAELLEEVKSTSEEPGDAAPADAATGDAVASSTEVSEPPQKRQKVADVSG